MSKSLYANHQWAVTKYGVETVPPESKYHFEASRLTEMRGDGEDGIYDWPVHMAEKTWVNIESFIDVFKKALELHVGRYAPPVDSSVLAKSLAAARREAARR
jgi:hypothetical protein